MTTLLHSFLKHGLYLVLKHGLYLAAILLLPGALIGAPILWWLGHRNAKRTALPASVQGIDGRCLHC